MTYPSSWFYCVQQLRVFEEPFDMSTESYWFRISRRFEFFATSQSINFGILFCLWRSISYPILCLKFSRLLFEAFFTSRKMQADNLHIFITKIIKLDFFNLNCFAKNSLILILDLIELSMQSKSGEFGTITNVAINREKCKTSGRNWKNFYWVESMNCKSE